MPHRLREQASLRYRQLFLHAVKRLEESYRLHTYKVLYRNSDYRSLHNRYFVHIRRFRSNIRTSELQEYRQAQSFYRNISMNEVPKQALP